jgi:hypothetical protein
MFRLKKDEASGPVKLHKEEIRDLYKSLCIARRSCDVFGMRLRCKRRGLYAEFRVGILGLGVHRRIILTHFGVEVLTLDPFVKGNTTYTQIRGSRKIFRDGAITHSPLQLPLTSSSMMTSSPLRI